VAEQLEQWTSGAAEEARSVAERERKPIAGPPMVAGVIAAALLGVVLIVVAGASDSGGVGVIGGLLIVLAVLASPGFFVLQPNEASVLVLFGRYVGTVRREGWWWVFPLTVRKGVSLRLRNLDGGVLKVNDAVGNPVEIAAVIVWRVTDTAMAVFDVDDYSAYVAVQTETAVRHVASEYPYDAYEDGQASLRANADQVTATLQAELQDRLDPAGVAVVDTRLRRLNYAPEIAQEMLRRQQASAVVAARQRIVEGAVGMVEMALQLLSDQHIVDLDEERKAHMVSNLLVVLCSDRGTQPVVNAGSLYG
jgi:regulator of protease activity HflC (stomatin/prohibitin superfamily)